MTKRQWFLVAGTLVLSACGSLIEPNQCEFKEETQESFCYTRSEAEPSQAPTPAIDAPSDDNPNP